MGREGTLDHLVKEYNSMDIVVSVTPLTNVVCRRQSKRTKIFMLKIYRCDTEQLSIP